MLLPSPDDQAGQIFQAFSCKPKICSHFKFYSSPDAKHHKQCIEWHQAGRRKNTAQDCPHCNYLYDIIMSSFQDLSLPRAKKHGHEYPTTTQVMIFKVLRRDMKGTQESALF